METFLEPIYGNIFLQVVFGLLLAAVLIVPVHYRYTTLVGRYNSNELGLALYHRSSLWLAFLLGFVGAFLPAHLLITACFVLPVVILNTVLVARVRRRNIGAYS